MPSTRDLAGVHFTGSSVTFNEIWKRIGSNIANYRNYPRIVGETGGKDFILAHESAAPSELIVAMLRGAFEYQGQKCSAASRAYVPASLWKQIEEPFLESVEQIPMGDPTDFGNFMGAVIDEKSYDKIKSYIVHAKKSKDAKVLCGGAYNNKKLLYSTNCDSNH